MKRSENINELALALSKVQGSISPAKKISLNPRFTSKYADLTAIWEACREELALHQLSVTQGPEDNETHLIMTTLLMHSSGQWIESKMMLAKTMFDKKTQTYSPMSAQDIGSAITYLRRYSLASIVGICTEDDDGNKASMDNRNSIIDINKKDNNQNFSANQIDELQSILDRCPTDYKKWFFDEIKFTYKATKLYELHSSLFDHFKQEALKYVIK